MNYVKGDRVRHPNKPEWKLGEVLEDSTSESVRVFFLGAGEKKLSLKFVQPEKVLDEEGKHPGLDHLQVSHPSKGIVYRSLPESIDRFLERFPQGFYGERFAKEERNYKTRAHELAKELLNQDSLAELILQEEFGEVCKRAMRVVNATNLLFPNEKMALKDGLTTLECQEKFSKALHNILYGIETLETRFTSFCGVLEEIRAAKWTTATYFLFIRLPEQFMFVKPTITQNAAEITAFGINYRAELNWLTYKCVLEFSEYLMSELENLKPRDMIDVQSFMWCIAPGKY
jgi:hypothetical protein